MSIKKHLQKCFYELTAFQVPDNFLDLLYFKARTLETRKFIPIFLATSDKFMTV